MKGDVLFLGAVASLAANVPIGKPLTMDERRCAFLVRVEEMHDDGKKSVADWASMGRVPRAIVSGLRCVGASRKRCTMGRRDWQTRHFMASKCGFPRRWDELPKSYRKRL